MKRILLLLTLLNVAAGADDKKPLNILVLNADDWRFDTLGCAGNSVVKTPHLDQLASEGVRFTQNCVITSICAFKLEQLFHIATDPFEENDLASDPAHTERLAEMRHRFAKLQPAAR